MAKKTIAAFTCLTIAFAQVSLAYSGKKHVTIQQSSPSNSIDNDNSDKPIIQPTDELSGSICLPYRYTSEINKSQILGVLKNKNVLQSSTSDVNPAESLVGEQQEPIKPAPVKKIKKTKIQKIKKGVVKPEVKIESPAITAQESKESQTAVGNDRYQEQQPDQAQVQPMVDEQNIKSQTPPSVIENNKKETQNTDAQSLENKTEKKVEGESKPSQPITSSNAVGRMLAMDFSENELELSESQKTSLNQLTDDFRGGVNSMIKIHSYGFAKQGDVIESRRAALQRSIKIRKYLIEKGINPNDITVNVSDDNTSNKVELTIEQK